MPHPASVALTALGALSTLAHAQSTITNIPLDYNFNGIAHFGEMNVPDDPNGFRSISDRALEFTFGVPAHPVLDQYSIVADPGVLDIVHLGDRDTVANGNHTFDFGVPGADPNVGEQPVWLPFVDQSGPQTTFLPAPILMDDASAVGVLFQISNGGGTFDVRLIFDSGADIVGTLEGPDWFGPFGGTPAIGEFLGTQDVDQANFGDTLLITEGFVDAGAAAGRSLIAISFENRSNLNGGYAIIAANAIVDGRGACCLGNGTCVDGQSVADCAAQGGTFQGLDTVCGGIICPVRWDEQLDGGGDAREEGIANAQPVDAGFGELPTITGTLTGATSPGGGDNDVYLIEICDFQNFSASTIGGASFDTMLFLFNEDGSGQVWNDDFDGTLQSTITSQGVFANGVYALAISAFSSDPLDEAGQPLFDFTVYPGPDPAQRMPVGFEPYVSWEGDPDTGDYTITLTGACFLGDVAPACPCDWNSDSFLNNTDFFDFVNDFFAGTGPQGQSDYNEDTFENAQDFFDFINCFFGTEPGC